LTLFAVFAIIEVRIPNSQNSPAGVRYIIPCPVGIVNLFFLALAHGNLVVVAQRLASVRLPHLPRTVPREFHVFLPVLSGPLHVASLASVRE